MNRKKNAYRKEYFFKKKSYLQYLDVRQYKQIQRNKINEFEMQTRQKNHYTYENVIYYDNVKDDTSRILCIVCLS